MTTDNRESDVPLSALQPGQQCRVVGIDVQGGGRGRLMELGLTRNAVVEVIRFAPLGDPMEIKVRGGHLSLRKSEAACVRVQLLSNPAES
jgi:Fe2+ transport system protein FeoA